MARFAELLIDSQFANGVTTYADSYPGDEANSRIVLTISIERRLTTEAIVDTGAPWCILDPELVEQLGISPDATYESTEKLRIRGISYEGRLHRLQIGLWSEEAGSDLEVDATVFVPRMPPQQEWPHPNFLGLNGFLERIRFAVNPEENAFYFGSF
jgi:hypothetical protein